MQESQTKDAVLWTGLSNNCTWVLGAEEETQKSYPDKLKEINCYVLIKICFLKNNWITMQNVYLVVAVANCGQAYKEEAAQSRVSL